MKSKHTVAMIITAMKAWGFASIGSCIATGAAYDTGRHGVAVAFGLMCTFCFFAFCVCSTAEGCDE